MWSLEMNDLIAVQNKIIGKKVVQAVSARDLYLGLGLASAVWARWSKSNIEENEFFKEKTDWIGFNTMLNGNETRDFAITIEFAKHVAMMAKTSKAHDYRNYLISCEESAQKSNRHIDLIREVLLLDAPSEWVKLYPDSFYQAIMAIYGHDFDSSKNKPMYCAQITRRWVYDIVLPMQLQIEIDCGRGNERKHQWFTKENGRQHLLVQIGKVEMIARLSQSRADFEANCARAFLSAPLQLTVNL